MSLIEQIAELMMREGDIKAQEQREIIASQEEQRQAKHRTLKNILKFAATVGPYFIPGAGIVPALTRVGVSAAGSRIPTSLGRVPAGLGFNQFSGPMGHNDWYQTPWDEEGVG